MPKPVILSRIQLPGLNTFTSVLFIIPILHTTFKGHAQSFEEVSENVGITHFQHDPHLISGGVAIFDFNNDGFEDIYFTGGLEEDKLYENDGEGSFTDASYRLESDLLKTAFTHGVAIGDIDNDGYDDIFVTTHKGYGNILLVNYQGEKFIDVSGRLKSSKRDVWSMSASMADADLDGDLDIYVGNFVDYETEEFRDESISSTVANTLYINRNGSFTDEAEEFGVANEGSTLAVCFTDANDDGYPDIYVANDHGLRFSPNALYLNDPMEEQFQKTPVETGADVAINSMGIAIGDYDEDEDLDYYITHITDNVLLNNDLKNTSSFTDLSTPEAVQSTIGVSWGTVFFDFDNDTYLDLYVANGDMFGIDIPQKNVLYERKEGKFSNVSDQQGVSDASRSRGVAYGDLNNDGLPDLVVVAVSSGEGNIVNNSVFQNRNTSDRHWAKIRLEGSVSNRSAYGTRVKVFAGNRTFIREVDGGSSYLSQNSAVLHFGMGQASMMDSVEVKWPGGHSEVYRSLQTDRMIYIKENDNAYYHHYMVERKECRQDSVLIFGKLRTQPAIYYDTVHNNAVKEVYITTLKPAGKHQKECSEAPKEAQESRAHLYPNPFGEELFIYLPAMENNGDQLTVSINKMTGKTFRQLTIQPGEDDTIQIPESVLEQLPSGMYWITVRSASDILMTGKVIRN